MIETYVASGYGIGLFLDIPTLKLSAKVRSLPLADFPPVTFGVLWQGQATPLIQAFLDAFQFRAKELLSGTAASLPPSQHYQDNRAGAVGKPPCQDKDRLSGESLKTAQSPCVWARMVGRRAW